MAWGCSPTISAQLGAEKYTRPEVGWCGTITNSDQTPLEKANKRDSTFEWTQDFHVQRANAPAGLGSTLFINDLPDEATDGVKSALYADDTKLYQNVSSTEHCHLIQMTLSNLHDWSQRNNIRFNTSKCKALSVTRKKTTPIVLTTPSMAQFWHASQKKEILESS